MAKQKEIKFRERGNVLEGRRGNLTFALYSDISQTAPDKGTYSVVVRHKDIERRFFPKGTNFDSLIYLLQSGCEFIRNNSKVRFAKEAQYRVDKPDYAERAVTEAVVNALIHRDYIVLGSEIHIDMYDDRVEIVSPGGMFEGAPVQECDINTIRSVRRNPVISDRCRDTFLRTIAGNLDGEERTFVMAWIYAAYEWAGRFPPYAIIQYMVDPALFCEYCVSLQKYLYVYLQGYFSHTVNIV